MRTSVSRRWVLSGAMGLLIAPVGINRSASAVMPVTHTVEIFKLKYVPEILTVRKGDRVRWINRDIAPHTATALNRSWDTGELGLGDEVTLDVTADIPVDYFCAFHPHMWGKVQLA